MNPIQPQELASWLVGIAVDANIPVRGFATDHREVKPGDAFLAVRGSRVDGHGFVADALKAGAVLSIVEQPAVGPHILVDDLVHALARMAKTIRARFMCPVIGVTGSAGKTTTKEFLAASLRPLGQVAKTEGNRNTEYTAPLMWAEMHDQAESTAAVVVEMAMRGFGQIAHLAEFSSPTMGLITNIGFGHLEMVGDRAGIARAKAELFHALPPTGIAIAWAEDEYLEFLRTEAAGRQLMTFGFSESAHCRVVGYEALDWDLCRVSGFLEALPWQAVLPAIGRHIALNAAAAVLTASLCGLAPEEAARAMQRAELPGMRMEVIDRGGVTLVLDAYNASPPAFEAAIESLLDLPVKGRRVAVAGAMRELGDATNALHRDVGESLAALDSVIFYGEPMSTIGRQAAIDAGLSQAFRAESLDDIRDFLQKLEPGDVALVKGSRALELEKAIP